MLESAANTRPRNDPAMPNTAYVLEVDCMRGVLSGWRFVAGEEVRIDPRLGIGDGDGVDGSHVKADRARPPDDRIHVPELSKPVEGGDAERRTDPSAAVRGIDAGRPEEVRRSGFDHGKPHDLLL